MKPKNFLKATEVSIGDLVGYKERRFVIPYNQRPWSWKKANLEEFWNDVLCTLDKFFTNGVDELFEERDKRIGNPHFFGAFVFEVHSEEECMVVDGQQRLTSLIMMFSIFREIAERCAFEEIDPELKMKLEKLSARCTKIINVEIDGNDESRLCVDEEFKLFFDACIVNPKDSDTRKKLINAVKPDYAESKILKNIDTSYSDFQTLIFDHCSRFTGNQTYHFINSAIKTVKEYFLCLSVNVNDEVFSLEVFKCLNAKSLGLNEVDKIKNELFLLSKLEEHNQIKKAWDRIVGNIPQGDIGLFIRYRYLALKGECSRDRMYTVIRDHEISLSKPSMLIDLWKKDSEIFSWITLKKNKKFLANVVSNNKITTVLNDISVLGLSLAWIPCFAAIKTNLGADDETLYKLLQLIRNVSFRMMTVGKVDVGIFEPCLSISARMITEGKKVKDIARHYRDNSPDDIFENEFSKLTVKVAKKQFYILAELDRYLSKGSGVVPGGQGLELSVEHILPKKFSTAMDRESEWGFAKLNPNLHKDYLNRLGNLCLLEGDINGDVASFDYSAKRNALYPLKFLKKKEGHARLSYKDSAMPMVKQLLKPAYEKWEFKVIDERQKDLAKIALRTWPLNLIQLNKLT